MPYWTSGTLDQSNTYCSETATRTATNCSANSSPTCAGCHCLQTQASAKCQKMTESEQEVNAVVTGAEQTTADSNNQGNSKKSVRKTAKVKPEEVSTPTHFEHLVHIEDLQSNANNFVVPKVSQDPVIKNIFSVIEKNIVDGGGDSATAAATATIPESRNKSSSSSSLLKLFIKNQNNGTGNNDTATAGGTSKFFVNGTEAYDNLNELIIPTDKEHYHHQQQQQQQHYQQQQQQQQHEPAILERNNLQLSLKCTTDDDGKRHSIPDTLAPDLEQRFSQSSAESTVILPSRKKLTQMPSSDSTDDTPLSPMTPFAPTLMHAYQNLDLKKQEAAYDALVSRTGNGKKPMSPLYENQEMIAGMATTKGSGTRNSGPSDEMETSAEIQQALKQLDDVLDEQIPIEAFATQSAKPARPAPPIPSAENSESVTDPEDRKKSVKQLAEMLNSKPLHFGAHNVPLKFHAADRNPESTEDQEGNAETDPEATIPRSGSGSETNSDALQQQSKPSLIGVSIFGPNTGKSIAEIIAEKRNRKGGPRPPLPLSPKPTLKKRNEVPKPDISSEEEHDRKPSSSQTIASSDLPEKPSRTIFDSRRSAPKGARIIREGKPEVPEEQQKRPKPKVPPALPKFPAANSQLDSMVPKTAGDAMQVPITTSSGGADLNRNACQINKPSSKTYGNYENLNPNDDDGSKPVVLETSFDGPVATIPEPVSSNTAAGSMEKRWNGEERKENPELASTSGSMTSGQDIVSLPPEQQQRTQSAAGVEKSPPFIENASIVGSMSPSTESIDLTSIGDVKWRTGYVAPVDSDGFTDNDPHSEPVPPLRTRSKRGSYRRSRTSSQQQQQQLSPRVVQRSTSMYTSSGSNDLSGSFAATATTESADDTCGGEYRKALKRWSSVSTPETVMAPQIPNERSRIAPLVPPKPAPRRIDYLKRPPLASNNKVADISEAENTSAGKSSKRPVPIPRQSKLKAALNDDLLKKSSFTGTKKTQHGTVNGLEPLITIAKATNASTNDYDDGSEWTLRL